MEERKLFLEKTKIHRSCSILVRIQSLAALVIIMAVFVCMPILSKENTQVWAPAENVPGPEQHPAELIKLGEDLRAIRSWGSGIPDFAAIVKKQKEELPKLRARLDSLDISEWSYHNKIDYLILRTEMDSLEFDLYVWRRTTRNPTLYVNSAIRNVSQNLASGRRMGERYPVFPLNKEQAEAILQALADTEKYLAQGRKNLTEIVPELADIALRNPGGGYYTPSNHLIRDIENNYKKWAEITAKYFPPSEAKKLVPAALKAAKQLREFGEWLEQNRKKMTGKYYIGKDAVDWYLRHVMLLPDNSDQIMAMAEIERGRALAYIQYELHKNRYLPVIRPAKTAKDYIAWDDETALLLRRWYTENGENILTDPEYQPLIRSKEAIWLNPFGFIAFPNEKVPGVHFILVVPDDHWRAKYSNMGFRTDPAALHGHEYWPGHTFQSYHHPRTACPIRAGHRDGAHSEGWCFYNEELLVALDFPFIRGPRARELVYINMLQRANRMLQLFPLIFGEISAEECRLRIRAHLPPLGSGLGASLEESYDEMEGFLQGGSLPHLCMVGKHQIYRILADRKMQLMEKFDIKDFHDQIMRYGQIPFSLVRWEILGDDSEANIFWKATRLSSILKKE